MYNNEYHDKNKLFYKDKSLGKLEKELLKVLINNHDNSAKYKEYEKVAKVNNKKINVQKFNNDSKEYELFNVLAENSNSIYAANTKEVTNCELGEVFISANKIKDIIAQLIKQELGLS